MRAADLVNGYASAVTVGARCVHTLIFLSYGQMVSLTDTTVASWNKSLAFERGQHMFSEFRRKGVQVALGPGTGYSPSSEIQALTLLQL